MIVIGGSLGSKKTCIENFILSGCRYPRLSREILSSASHLQKIPSKRKLTLICIQFRMSRYKVKKAIQGFEFK